MPVTLGSVLSVVIGRIGQVSERDPIDGAHLTRVSRPSPPIHRYPPSDDLVDLVQRYWVPVWALDAPQEQSTLQHPACLIVVSNTYARFYGPSRGRSTVTLEGEGWAFGTMLMPATGRLLLGRPLSTLVNAFVDLRDVPGLDGADLSTRVTTSMTSDPHNPLIHARARDAVEQQLRSHLPLDDIGHLVNEVVAHVRDDADLLRVADLASRVGVPERTLHRLVVDRVGLSPKWLIQRRRLHDAVHELKVGPDSLAALAADLGYSDQAHFTQDFRRATGMTPGAYLADQP